MDTADSAGITMATKYGIANELIAQVEPMSRDNNIDPADAYEATIVMLVQAMKEAKGPDYVRGVLQYEMDSLGSGGVYEIARGGGHS